MALDKFVFRHTGPKENNLNKMLKKIGTDTLDSLIDQTIPPSIRLTNPLDLPDGISEYEYYNKIKKTGSKNQLFKCYIGMGFYDTIFPAVIQRNILENPSWYTSYTPYQAEISQGRLEALLNFQTVIMDLTAMELANASLLDESTAAAEAMLMMYNVRSRDAIKNGVNKLFIDENIFPQTIDVIKTHAAPLGIILEIGKYNEMNIDNTYFGTIIQYPDSDGKIEDYSGFAESVHNSGCLVAVIADILSLVLITPPGEWGADIVVGSTQRFGIPMGYGGPHAAYFATREKFKRNIPGRIIGVSVDAQENIALRMALQTREQHIKRERATSNICTAQALLATMAGMYAVYHGPSGLKRIAGHIHAAAGLLSEKLNELGYIQENKNYFDTLKVKLPGKIESGDIQKLALKSRMNFKYIDNKTIGISLDETTLPENINDILRVFASANNSRISEVINIQEKLYFNNNYFRESDFLTDDVFNRYFSETDMMRYIKKLERKDISLTQSMISLGSCTMKLTPAVSLAALSWPEFGGVHPFVPEEQAGGYKQLFEELASDLLEITGLQAISFMPNSGASGEYTGLMVIREYHINNGEDQRNVVLIPSSAHGTNPASGVMAGMEVIVIGCDENGNVEIDDLREKAEKNKDKLAAFMVTYPSTHGVFESRIRDMIDIIHKNGGLVYMDGANMNAQVGLTNPGIINVDVCHLNLHKTFGIPHGGGGPGMGPIAVAERLVEYLPSHPVIKTGGAKGMTAVAAAPWGSASILTISHAYCRMLGREGLTHATKIAILNANYIASSLKDYYNILYTGENGYVAHEMILDCRIFKEYGKITEGDIAKRLMDYGFHAPTLSFPVHGTLMVEPTESESFEELNRFIEAMISIYNEIMEIKDGKVDLQDNVLKNSPHTVRVITSDKWGHSYTRQKAAFPLKWTVDNKFWPSVGRIDDAYGDRNLLPSSKPISDYTKELYNLED